MKTIIFTLIITTTMLSYCSFSLNNPTAEVPKQSREVPKPPILIPGEVLMDSGSSTVNGAGVVPVQ